MGTPVRFTNGVSTDLPWTVLGYYGLPNPFTYHTHKDDFDYSANVTSLYTATKTSSGTIAQAAGDGGVALFTTNASTPLTTDICSLQLPAASFALAAGKKAFFLTRLKQSSASNNTFLVGLIQTTTTPFTVTDGIYFSKATGAANNLTIKNAASSTITTGTIPTSAYTLADATYIDLGFFLDRSGQINAFVGSNLLSPNSTVRGEAYAFTPPALASATLNVTLAVQSGTASSKTMTVDFVMAAVER